MKLDANKTDQKELKEHHKNWSIHKFGGSSLQDASCFQRVKDIFVSLKLGKQKIAFVLSAIRGTTDRLIKIFELASDRNEGYPALLSEIISEHIDLIRDLFIENSLQEELIEDFKQDKNNLLDLLRAVWISNARNLPLYELISCYGEIWSTRIMSRYFESIDIKNQLVDAREILVVDKSQTDVIVDWKVSRRNMIGFLDARIEQISELGDNLIITGYIASNEEGNATTLDRNGSDFSAAVFGVLLHAPKVTIWTDVDGLYSADPSRVDAATKLDSLSYEEALELAYFGAKVLHPRTISPLLKRNIPLWIRNTFDTESDGTKIFKDIQENTTSENFVRGFATMEGIALVNFEGSGMMGVPGISKRVFGAFKVANVSVIMISQVSSEYSICIAIEKEDAEKARASLENEFELERIRGLIQSIKVDLDCGILAAVGDNMKLKPGIASIFFSALSRSRINVRMISQGSSERNISVVLDENDLTRGLNAVHSAFYLSSLTISVGIIGKGLVGSALLDQIVSQQEDLANSFNIDLRINAIADSKSMLIRTSQKQSKINSEIDWRELYSAEKVNLDIDLFAEVVQDISIPHSIIIDCSTSQQIADKYQEWLEKGIHIITANKKANSGTFEQYQSLKKYNTRGPSLNPLDKSTYYFYETTVGAGLPIITTIRDLLRTGDEIIGIEGIFSGTISFLFNQLSEKTTFSSIVLEAKSMGFTEPDPREDLSGLDFARKLVILGREIGLQIGLEDISIDPIIPEEFNHGEVDEWLANLENMNAMMKLKYLENRDLNQVLRYVGSIVIGPEGYTCKISLKPYPKSHPFANLAGSDNIVLFKTKRYNSQPLIIQGPGAGAEVTSAGVFAELLRLADRLGND
ncbi:MAG: bifunctional aspartate kinase/homoserine dehydrogenase I [Candidatus Heimdallarchaeota archaeon]|nr:bifunctional aspartate kinase/homoserine dehydrogenase I [Candidatus Heimdallarchaeota archaeon]